ncbi:aminodeoxychorismate lyase [Candidatus Blochmannia ocreatus (nom. nud.)]|uniref:Aminodeoxychorismate lyase n=1 Tax=Candidatus Blochmannia ocreatus (nom. nud.) TaxID=251538 RepID=A0ABY4SU99_9ENTR|nr:aminodeoxychorismate lyase [Candidatus Blochmannia ocreatus]URJ24907.1 aminodeoxychorismate lyase [Candidatus Blochmannia ocreatus]
MYWLNGVPHKKISLNNRGLHFGDGFFTTAKLNNGKIEFLDLHLDRLIISSNRLMFNCFDINVIRKEMLSAASCSGKFDVIKVIIVRSDLYNAPCKYRYISDIEPLRIICVSKLSNCYEQWVNLGIRLKTAIIRLSRNDILSGIKHINRLEQVMIANWIGKNSDADEALVLDTDGNVVECCSANIFWRYKYEVFTPSLYYAGVNGIMRQLVIKLLSELGFSVNQVMVGPKHLKCADEVFITNTLLPIVSVKSIDDCVYSKKTLFNLLNSYIKNNLIL